MKAVFFEMEPWENDHVRRAIKMQAEYREEPLTAGNAEKAKEAEVVSVFIYSHLTKEVLDKLPKLKLIATRSTGYDHIDVDECRKRKIAVSNVPYYGENTVAEHTFALILAISRKIPESLERAKHGNFSLEGLRGFDLKGKTIGIIGGGHIGQHVARIARGFEMSVLVYDLKREARLARKLGFRYASMDKIITASDIITLHVPYNKATHHLLDSAAFARMKKGAVIINTARGGIIDTGSLLKALQEKTISAAGLDVLEEECFIKEEKQLLSKEFPKECDLTTLLKDHMLMQAGNVFITPHNAFNSTEAMQRILDTTVESINSFKKGKRINAVR